MPPPVKPAAGATDGARAQALFEEVCALFDDQARRRRLAELGASAAMVVRVLALVATSDATTHRAQPAEPALPAASGGSPETGPSPTGIVALAPIPGDRLGPWLLVSEIGQGGMGRVYLAERADGHYRQRVAIKLLRGWSSPAALAHLTRERQILASLNHPNIARLIDGGTTSGGQPYLVLEHVQGKPIDAWCRDHAPPAGGVLALFERVCDAVGYAHRQLVVHCDIKPANILVDAEGRVKLLDFGIAHLPDQEPLAAQAHTPAYASPEQRAGAQPTPASDLYALGRVLDELLRAATPPAPRPREWQAIVACASAEHAEQRYSGVPALLDDLAAWRDHRPLRAIVPSAGYRVHKFLRRHWAGAAAATLAAAVAVVLIVRLVHERDRALQAQAQASAARQFLVSLFQGADPRQGGHPERSAQALLDQGRRQADRSLQGQPALHAAMAGVLAEVYENIGHPLPALELYRQALELQRGLPSADPLVQARLLGRLAVTLANENRAVEALAPARRSLALRLELLPDGDVEVADAYNTLGLVLNAADQWAEAEKSLETALAMRRGVAGGSVEEAATLHNLGLVLVATGRVAEAEQTYRQALALKQRHLPRDHPSTLNSAQSLAVVLARQGRRDEAALLLHDLVARQRAVHGELSLPLAGSLNELAGVLQDSGKLAEAVAAYRQAQRLYAQLTGPRSAESARVLNNLATALDDQDDPAAEAAYRESLAIRQSLQPPQRLDVARAQFNLGRWLLRAGRAGEAGPWLAAADATRRELLPAGHRDRLRSQFAAVEWMLAEQRVADARSALVELAAREPTMAPHQRIALRRVQALLAQALGHAQEARSRWREAVALARAELDPHDPALRRLLAEAP